MSASYGTNDLRASKTNSAGTTYYLSDGAAPVVEVTASGTVSAVNTFAVTGLLSRYAGSNSTFYDFDEKGDVAERLNSSATILSHDVYDDFGTAASTATETDPWCYEAQAGYYTDRETGLIYCQHRYYDLSVGRWLNRDPIGYDGGVNAYGYVGNGGDNFTDPSGTFITTPSWIWRQIIRGIGTGGDGAAVGVGTGVTIGIGEITGILSTLPIIVLTPGQAGGNGDPLPINDPMPGQVGQPGYIGKKPNKRSQEEMSTDAPSWSIGMPRYAGETCQEFATRIEGSCGSDGNEHMD